MMAMRPPVSVSDYIQHSQTVKINNINYHSYFNKSIGGNRKNKVDYGASFSFPKNKDGIFIVVNTSEITSHQGSYKDPIPAMNFSLDGQEYK